MVYEFATDLNKYSLKEIFLSELRTCSRLSRPTDSIVFENILKKMSGGDISADTTVRAAATQDLRFSEQDPLMSEIMDHAQLETSDQLRVAENDTRDGDSQTKRQRCEVLNPPRNHHRYSYPNRTILFGECALMKIGDKEYTMLDCQYVDAVLKHAWYVHGSGYACHTVTTTEKDVFCEKKFVFLHQFILDCEKRHKPDGNINIDHKNRCKRDNRVCNLRYTTPGQNTSNKTYERIRTNIGALNEAGIYEFPRFVNFYPEGGDSDKHGDRFGIENHPNLERNSEGRLVTKKSKSARDVHIAAKYRQILKMVIELDGGHDERTGMVTSAEEDAETKSIFDEANAHILNMCLEEGVEVDVNDPEVFFKLEEVQNTCAGHLRKLENYYKFVTSSESPGRELGPREIKDEGMDEDGDIVVHQDSSMTLTRGKMMPDHWSFLKAGNNRAVGLNYRDKAAGVAISSNRKSDTTLKHKYIELLGKLVEKNVTSEDECSEMLDTLVEKNIISQEEKAGTIAGITSGEECEKWYYKVFPMDIVVVHQDSSMTLTRDMMPEHWSFLQKDKNSDIGLNYEDKSAGVRITSNRKSDTTLKYKYIEFLGKLVEKNVTSEDECSEMLDTLVEKNIISQEEKAGTVDGITSGKGISSWYYKVFLKDVVVVHQDSSMTLTRDIMPEHWNFHNKNKYFGNGLVYNPPGVKVISSNRKKDGSLKDKYLDLLKKLVKGNVTSEEECLNILDTLVKKNIMSHEEMEGYMRELGKRII